MPRRRPRTGRDLVRRAALELILLAAAAVFMVAVVLPLALAWSAGVHLTLPRASPTGSVSPTPIVTPAGGPPRVVGTVTAGPVCAVEQSPPDPKCAPRPVAGAVIVATDLTGTEVGRTTTAPDGTYWLPVGATGTVVVTALPVAGLPGSPAPHSVTLIDSSDVEHADFEYDTGIR